MAILSFSVWRQLETGKTLGFSAGLFVSCFKTKIETRDDSVLMSPLSLLAVI